MIAPAPARWTWIVAALAASIAATALLYRFDPNAPGSLFPGCVFHSLTGYYCPGCGLTRMLHALVHGDVARAASMNALGLVGLPTAALVMLNEAFDRRVLAGPLRAFAYNGRLWLVAAIVFGVLRNLPYAPFAALAPA